MKAVVFCDDFTFAARVRTILLRVGRQPEVGVRWKVKAWPLISLDDAASAERIVDEAADAHLVVIPAEYARSLPDRLQAWLDQWALRRQIEAVAIGVVGDASTIGTELELLAERHGLSLLTNEGRVSKYSVQSTQQFSQNGPRSLAAMA